MGHLRTGAIPRTRHWRDVVDAVVSAFGGDDLDVRAVAERTLVATRQALKSLPHDPVLQRCFSFLVALAVAGGSPDASEAAQRIGLRIEGHPDKLGLSKALRSWIGDPPETQLNPELATLSRQATVDTVAAWMSERRPLQDGLFPLNDPYFSWREAASGSGFCELSRTFFAKFMQRYMGYFLSRVTAPEMASVPAKERFETAITSEMDKIAQHTFETSKLIQSFSAGWFNKRAVSRLPDKDEVQSFLSHGLAKFGEELRREGVTSA